MEKETSLKIVNAYYGPEDVTEKIRNFMVGDSLYISTSLDLNMIFSDPQYGVAKKLRITVIYNSIKSTYIFEEYCSKLKTPCILPHKVILSSIIPQVDDWFKSLYGIEIGGPSKIVEDMGIYRTCLVDCVNFSNSTTWSEHGELFFNQSGKLLGRTFISESTDLIDIKDNYYDFVVASHVLEHIANPLLALKEWTRILKVDGLLLLILPWKDGTFDHRRQVTSFDDLLHHYKSETKEDDLSHLDEILALHDLSKDTAAGTLDQFKQRSLKNYENRCLHQHVFDFDLMRQCLDHFNFSIMHLSLVEPCHQIVIAKKE